MPKEPKVILAIMPMTPAQKQESELKNLRWQKNRAANGVTSNLQKVVNQLEEVTESIRRAFKIQAETDPDFLNADRVRQIIHDIMWTIPHLNLEYLAGNAADLQQASALIAALEQVPLEGFTVNPDDDYDYTGDKFTEVIVNANGKKGELEPLCVYRTTPGSITLRRAGGPYPSVKYIQELSVGFLAATDPQDSLWFHTGAAGNPPMLIRTTPMPTKNEEAQ